MNDAAINRHGLLAPHIAVSSLLQLESAPLAETDSLLITRPQATFELAAASRLRSVCSVTWTVDHFVQVEALNALHLTRPLDVVIATQSEKPGMGVRPGVDAVQLARGLQQIPGARVVGLLVQSTSAADSTASLRGAQHTLQQLQVAGLQTQRILFVANAESLPTALPAATELIIRCTATTSSEVPAQSTSNAEVISRPSLEHAVLAVADHSVIGSALLFPSHPLARLVCWQDDTCVINAASTPRLEIGQPVRIAVAPFDNQTDRSRLEN